MENITDFHQNSGERKMEEIMRITCPFCKTSHIPFMDQEYDEYIRYVCNISKCKMNFIFFKDEKINEIYNEWASLIDIKNIKELGRIWSDIPQKNYNEFIDLVLLFSNFSPLSGEEFLLMNIAGLLDTQSMNDFMAVVREEENDDDHEIMQTLKSLWIYKNIFYLNKFLSIAKNLLTEYKIKIEINDAPNDKEIFFSWLQWMITSFSLSQKSAKNPWNKNKEFLLQGKNINPRRILFLASLYHNIAGIVHFETPFVAKIHKNNVSWKPSDYTTSFSRLYKQIGIELEDFQIRWMMGEISKRQQKFQLALAELQYAHYSCPQNHIITHSLANTYLINHDYGKALLHLQKTLEIKPDFLPAMRKLGTLFYVFGDMEKAEKYFLQTIEKNPGDRDVMEYLSNIYSEKGEFSESLDVLTKLHQYHPYEPAKTFLYISFAYAGLNDEANMTEYLDKFRLSTDTEQKEKYKYLGKILKNFMKDQIYGAILNISKKLHVIINDPLAWDLVYINACLEKGMLAEAEAELKRICENQENKQNATVLYLWGKLYLMEEKYHLAYEFFSQSHQLAFSGFTGYKLAEANFRLKNYDTALEELEYVEGELRFSAPLDYLRAKIYLAMGDKEKALENIQDIITDLPFYRQSILKDEELRELWDDPALKEILNQKEPFDSFNETILESPIKLEELEYEFYFLPEPIIESVMEMKKEALPTLHNSKIQERDDEEEDEDGEDQDDHDDHDDEEDGEGEEYDYPIITEGKNIKSIKKQKKVKRKKARKDKKSNKKRKK